MTFEIGADGIPVYNESFKNGLREFYSGVKGCIYNCMGDFLVDENTTIKHAVVSKEPVLVASATPVEDAYSLILQNEAEGLLKINHYETLSQEQKQKDRNMILGAIKNLDLLKGQHLLSAFVSEKFPDLWDEASHMG